MKNLRKKITGFTVIMMLVFNVAAQEDPSKETVIVNPFTHNSAVTNAMTENVRAAVLSGFSKRGRFHIVDATTDAQLKPLYEGRKMEDVVNDANWKAESSALYKSMGAKKLVIGTLNNVSFSSVKSSVDNSAMSQADVAFSLKVYNIEDGSMTASEDISVTAYSTDNTRDGAFNSAMEEVNKAMTKFVDTHFKFETYILELGEADKKGAVKQLYISGGSEMGVVNRTRFKVYAEKQIGPKVMRTEVGLLVAAEVSEGVTQCNVSKGGDVIKDKFNNGEKLIVVLDRQGGLTGTLGQIGL